MQNIEQIKVDSFESLIDEKIPLNQDLLNFASKLCKGNIKVNQAFLVHVFLKIYQ